jgi:hypothetical protein
MPTPELTPDECTIVNETHPEYICEMQYDEDAMRIALRVLTALTQKNVPDPEDVEQLRAIAPGETANRPVDEMAREAIQNGVRNLRQRKAWA